MSYSFLRHGFAGCVGANLAAILQEVSYHTFYRSHINVLSSKSDLQRGRDFTRRIPGGGLTKAYTGPRCLERGEHLHLAGGTKCSVTLPPKEDNIALLSLEAACSVTAWLPIVSCLLVSRPARPARLWPDERATSHYNPRELPAWLNGGTLERVFLL